MRRALLAVALCLAAACASRRLVLPTGPGAPTTEFRTAFDEASAPCRDVRTLRATIRLSGRVGGQRMRGTLLAGLEQPDALRLEGVAPFGPPAFILVARGGSATLLVPRDNRVLTGISGADILEALAGIRLDPAALRAMLTGCVTPDPRPSAGRSFENRWIAVDVGGGATAYLRAGDRAGRGTSEAWRIVAGVVPASRGESATPAPAAQRVGLAGQLEIQYQRFDSGLPRQVQLRSRGDQPTSVAVDLALALADVATNVTFSRAAFEVNVPPDAAPMTLAELREAGPLGAKQQ